MFDVWYRLGMVTARLHHCCDDFATAVRCFSKSVAGPGKHQAPTTPVDQHQRWAEMTRLVLLVSAVVTLRQTDLQTCQDWVADCSACTTVWCQMCTQQALTVWRLCCQHTWQDGAVCHLHDDTQASIQKTWFLKNPPSGFFCVCFLVGFCLSDWYADTSV